MQLNLIDHDRRQGLPPNYLFCLYRSLTRSPLSATISASCFPYISCLYSSNSTVASSTVLK